jgi:hypothetical protein
MQSVDLVKQILFYLTVEPRVKFVKARSHSEVQTPTRLVVIKSLNCHFSINCNNNLYYCSTHNSPKSMQSVILVKQTVLFRMQETKVKFIKARSHSEVQTPTRLVVKMGENRHFSILQFILLFDTRHK